MPSRFALVAAVVYLVMMTAIVGGMLRARATLVPRLESPEARAEWEAWRSDEARRAQEPGPVRRRAPKSREPLTLVQLRDYFWTWTLFIAGGASLLFLVTAVLLRGAMTTPAARGDGKSRGE